MIRRLLAAYDPYAVEVLLALIAGWIARCLWADPGRMTGPLAPYFRLVRTIDGDPLFWAALNALGAALLLTGLALGRWQVVVTIGLAARIVGLALAGFSLVVLGGSWLVASNDSLAAGPFLLLGLRAWAVLYRVPAIPGAPKP